MVSVTTIVLILLTILKVINGIEVLDTISVAQRVVNETEFLLGILGNSQEQISETEIEKVMKSLRSISNLIKTVPMVKSRKYESSAALDYLDVFRIEYPESLHIIIYELAGQTEDFFSITNNFTEINRKTLHEIFEEQQFSIINYAWFLKYYNTIELIQLDKLLANTLKERNNCNFEISPQHLLLDFYNQKLIVLLYAFRLALFKEASSTIFENKGHYGEIIKLKQLFRAKANEPIGIFKKLVQESDLSIWNCKVHDHFMHNRGETYEEVTNLLQGVIVNEADLNENRRCRYNVNKYSNGEFKVYGCSEQCDVITQCHNSVQNCEPINSVIEIVPAKNSFRRYERLEFNNKIFGRNTTSQSYTIQSFRGEWFSRCDYLFCICDDGNFDHQADIHFNLREYKTNISDNMVVTGVRFRKHNHVFHLEIQEGQLENECKINPDTVKWIPPQNYEINSTFPKKGIDYHTLTSSDRVISLDDVISDNSSYVVTGVKLSTPFLHLEIHLTEFDIKTGKLDPSNSFWKFNAETSERNELVLNEPDSIMNDRAEKVLVSGNKKFIKFRVTDYVKDAAQTVVPFIDIEEVTAFKPTPLSGVGIFYKGLNGYGGLIAPKLLTYDFSKDFIL